MLKYTQNVVAELFEVVLTWISVRSAACVCGVRAASFYTVTFEDVENETVAPCPLGDLVV